METFFYTIIIFVIIGVVVKFLITKKSESEIYNFYLRLCAELKVAPSLDSKSKVIVSYKKHIELLKLLPFNQHQ